MVNNLDFHFDNLMTMLTMNILALCTRASIAVQCC